MWRQMTVEHLIGRAQGGYLKQIRGLVAARFPNLPPKEMEKLSQRIDAENTVTACSFCNSTTSRDVSEKDMEQLLWEAKGNPDEVVSDIAAELKIVLERKRKDVQWKLSAIRQAFQSEVLSRIEAGNR